MLLASVVRIASSSARAAAARRFTASYPSNLSHVLVEKDESSGVAVVRLNRPKQLNALCDALFHELNAVMRAADADAKVGAIVLTGSAKAFAAGADIREMSSRSHAEVVATNMLGHWDELTKVSKPIIAAVNGYALGGGFELAMMCDIIIAGKGAKFGQPEITIGTIPGGGGSQRLALSAGKSKAMELVLTGATIDAEEARSYGLVSRVVPDEEVLATAQAMAAKIASFSKPVVALAKKCVNEAYELPLDAGLKYERKLFHSTFALADQKEGMTAFLDKRKPKWSDS